MTNKQRLEELKQQAKELANQIDQLEDQINNAQPTTGLLGRWATNRDGKQVLITADRPVGGWIETAYVKPDGATREKAEQLDSLTFPDQTTRPEDVSAGEAWLVNIATAVEHLERVVALKLDDVWWATYDDDRDGEYLNRFVTLITPLIPARPHDTPETVTTEEEYGALPVGSVVAARGEDPYVHRDYTWVSAEEDIAEPAEMAGTTRQVLRRGWGK